MMHVTQPDQFLDAPVTAWQASLGASERQQQEHYDNIAADYEAHYSDEWSVEYRRKFIYDPMFEGLNLSGMKVLDAMCGSGQTTTTQSNSLSGKPESRRDRFTTLASIHRAWNVSTTSFEISSPVTSAPRSSR